MFVKKVILLHLEQVYMIVIVESKLWKFMPVNFHSFFVIRGPITPLAPFTLVDSVVGLFLVLPIIVMFLASTKFSVRTVL